MESDGTVRVKRLRWLCRRGMKELDLLLEAFVEREQEALKQGAWPELESFLESEDDQLWDWVKGHERPREIQFRELLGAIVG